MRCCSSSRRPPRLSLGKRHGGEHHHIADVSNSPSFEEKAALDFFTTSTGNLLAAEKTLDWRTPAEALDELLHSGHQASVATTP
jgi:hypothetical protein